MARASDTRDSLLPAKIRVSGLAPVAPVAPVALLAGTSASASAMLVFGVLTGLGLGLGANGGLSQPWN